jgi:hypothetical protein
MKDVVGGGVVVGFVVMEPKSPIPLRNDIMLTAADIS